MTVLVAGNAYISLWDCFSTIEATDFDAFTDPSNLTAMALQVHFLALESMMRPWLETGNLSFPCGSSSFRSSYLRSDNNLFRNTMQSFHGAISANDAALVECLVRWPRQMLGDSGGPGVLEEGHTRVG